MSQRSWSLELLGFAVEKLEDEVTWLRRLLVGTLISAVLGSIVSTTVVLLTRPG